MRYSKRYLIFTILLAILAALKFQFTGLGYTQVERFRGANLSPTDWNPLIAADTNRSKLVVNIDGREYTNLKDGVYMDQGLRLMFPADKVRDAFDCSVHLYDDRKLMVEKREDILQFILDEDYYIKNEEKQKKENPFVKENGMLYLAFDTLAKELGYACQWDMDKNLMAAQNAAAETGSILPYRYDLREKGRAPQVKDQGSYGTCWAFASLTALESSLLPQESRPLSVDHMDQNHSFSKTTTDGGQYTMAMAYLAGWQGPVDEADDPYGDGVSDASLTAVKHVQDMQILEAKNLDEIKEAVFKYGGVESCIYTTMQNADGDFSCYNSEKNAYCYVGEERPNHDIVIIGWDDSFPRENFQASLEGDGAFICQNSWGSDFGDDGVFYVSYYDTNIGIHNLVYTGVEDVDNYDHIYQSDLCGWVGQMGYNRESVYGANVFQAQSEEEVAAAAFYTTGRDTSYKVFIVPEFTDKDSLSTRQLAAEGQFANAGYHTVRLAQPVQVAKGRKFAVVIWLSTPNEVRPMAIEYAADELTQDVNLEDGEGYISVQGNNWAHVEKTSRCNLCIKAYTDSIAETD